MSNDVQAWVNHLAELRQELRAHKANRPSVQAQSEWAQSAHAGGRTQQSITYALAKPKSTVRTWLEGTVHPNLQKPVLVPDELGARYRGGEPVIEIAASLGVSEGTIYRVFRVHGIPLKHKTAPRKPRMIGPVQRKPRGRPKGGKNKKSVVSIQRDEQIREFRAQGLTLRDIAERLGTTTSAVQQRASKLRADES